MESGQSPHTKGVNGEDKGGPSGIVSVGHAPHKKGSQRVEEWNCPKEDKRSLHGEKMGQKYKKMVKKRACDVKREGNRYLMLLFYLRKCMPHFHL